MPKRQYRDQYINFGFIEMKNNGESVSQCVVCMKTLSNASMKSNLLQRHLQTNHPNKKRGPNHFKRLGENNKKTTTRQDGEAISTVCGDCDSLP